MTLDLALYSTIAVVALPVVWALWKAVDGLWWKSRQRRNLPKYKARLHV